MITSLQTFERPLYPSALPQTTSRLKVSNLHEIYYATYGNPKGIPVVVLHGGPGAGCTDGMAQFFDLDRWHVVMLDQRGAMRSTPFGEMEENTTQDLVEDIERLRKHLGIERWVVFGGSWGSSLALLYGQAFPDSCRGFILRGIWLVRSQDYGHLFEGMGKVFPELFQKVIDWIPEEERHDLLKAYYHRVMNPDPAIHLPASRIFMEYDLTASTHLPNPSLVQKMLENDSLVLGVTRSFCHYAMHQFFIKPNQILDEMDRIQHLPAILIHGRWDAICLPEMAYLLHKKWPGSHLWVVPNGGHSATDPAIGSALIEATDWFIHQQSQ